MIGVIWQRLDGSYHLPIEFYDLLFHQNLWINSFSTPVCVKSSNLKGMATLSYTFKGDKYDTAGFVTLLREDCS